MLSCTYKIVSCAYKIVYCTHKIAELLSCTYKINIFSVDFFNACRSQSFVFMTTVNILKQPLGMTSIFVFTSALK